MWLFSGISQKDTFLSCDNVFCVLIWSGYLANVFKIKSMSKLFFVINYFLFSREKGKTQLKTVIQQVSRL